MRVRMLLVIALIATAFGACSSSGGDTRTVLVDYESDNFAGTFRGYYPHDITVKPGMTIKFHQAWSGEPHTVTLGTEVEKLGRPLWEALEPALPRERPDSDAEKLGLMDEVETFFGTLPFFFGEKGINQAAGQPCYLDTGLPENDKACKKVAQPAFDGTQSYYSSGFIPYLGENGNEFEMTIADDAKPGSYFYYCALHGPAMGGEIIVTDDDDIPSQADVNREARKEIEATEKPLLAQLKKERAGKGDFTGNLAGSGTPGDETVLGQVNEFTPRTVQAKVNEPVTWTFIRNHSISFNVPEYVPWYDVGKNGTVTEDESVYQPAGGWPDRDPPTPDEADGPNISADIPAVTMNAGKFDGTGGLKSSGVDWISGDKYTVTFTKAGTYPMACLVHPGMIGKVVVS